uniref:Filamin B, beta (actin binding protein 278) n=1 Tax=Myripristis murdjan TaxID=586833 RepID=A0A667YJB0_9TELE
REAMQQADAWLGVPQVIAPEEIIDPCVDEQSIMTYLSMFPKAQLKPGAPLKPKSGVSDRLLVLSFELKCEMNTKKSPNPRQSYFIHLNGGVWLLQHQFVESLAKFVYRKIKTFCLLFLVSNAKACTATGRGLQPRGVRVGQVTNFKVDLTRAGPGSLEVHVKGPDGFDVPVKQKEASEGVSVFQYEPNIVGSYMVSITWAGEHIYKSPFEVVVGPRAGPQMIRAWGPGLERGIVEMSADFVVEAIGANAGMLGFAVEGPSQARIECNDQDDGSCDVRIWPTKPGEYAVHVICDDEEIEDSPFLSYINPNKKECFPHKASASLQSCCVHLFCSSLYLGHLYAEGKPVSVEVKSEEPGLHSCFYTPTSPLKHTFFVTWGGVSVPGSPFRVSPLLTRFQHILLTFFKEHLGTFFLQVMPGRIKIDPSFSTSDSESQGSKQNGKVNFHMVSSIFSELFKNMFSAQVEAYGPGLEGGFVGILADFTIDTSDSGSGHLSVTVDGPGPAKIKCCDNQDGTCTVMYLPTAKGEHLINIIFQGSHIPGSPFIVDIQMPFDPTKVVVSGPGLEKGKVGEPCIVNVSCALAGLGELSAEAVSETGQMAKAKVQENKDGTYTVVYVPLAAGVYTLRLKCGGKVLADFPSQVVVDPAIYTSHVKICGNEADVEAGGKAAWLMATCTVIVKGMKYSLMSSFYLRSSPFEVPVKEISDRRDATISGPGLESGVCAQIPQTYTIDCDKTGDAPESVAIMTPSGKIDCVEVHDIGNGTHSFVYCPSMEGDHSLVVKYAEDEAYSSPFTFQVLRDADKVRVSGPGLLSELPASLPAHFTVDTTEAGEGQLSVEIVDPDGRSKTPRIRDHFNGTYDVSYVPNKVGNYLITIEYSGEEIPTSPYHVSAVATGDANKCIVTGPELGSIIGGGEEIVFVVNAQSAGVGKVSSFVLTPDGNEVEADVTEREDGTFEIRYTTTQPGKHILSTNFGGETLFTCPLEVMVRDHGSYIPLASADQQNGLMPFNTVMALDVNDGKITGEVHMPSGSRTQAEVIDNRDGTVTFMYKPTEEGLHQMHIRASESPVQFYVNNTNKRELMAHGPGLVSGISNHMAAFTIFNKDLLKGDLDIALEGPSKAEIQCLSSTDGTCTVTYLPTVPGDYNIFIRYNDENITGSPFTAKIAGRSQARFGKVADFTLDITEEDISLLSVSITSPSGRDVSCLLKRQPDSHIGVSFIPKEAGEHLLSVLRNGEHVASSPIPLTINPSEIGDASRVKVFGPGLTRGYTCQISSFVVDTREAGFGGLALAIEGPSNVEIHTEELEDGTCGVSFCPTEAGKYTVSVSFTDKHVPGSPFTVVVTESGCVTDSITHYQRADSVADVGKTCGINLKIPGLALQHLSAEVCSPSGTTEEATVTITGCDLCSVSFVPTEPGVHTVSVQYKGQPIPGGLYQYTVGPLGEGGAEKVQAWGPGLMCAKTNIPAEFSIWAREAGAGDLSVTMEGPGKAELVFEDRDDGSCGISYVATEAGDYEVSVKFSGEHIQDSPFLVSVCAPEDDEEGQSKVTAHNLHRLAVFFSFFFVLIHDSVILAMARRTFNYISPSSMSTGHPMSGLKLSAENVCTVSAPWPDFLSDASKVASCGRGLSTAFLGETNVFSVDCSAAGTNLLLVGMHGPTRPCEQVSISYCGNSCYDISYVVKEKGSYILAVKWGEEHIPGSPFHVLVP